MISYLDRHRVLTALQVTRLLFDSAHTARHRLTELHRRDVLARFRQDVWPGSQPWRYTLGYVGAAVHAAATDASMPRPATISARALRLAHSSHTEHMIGVNDFFTILAHTARTRPGTVLAQWWPESMIAEACRGIVRPDGYGEYRDPRGTVGFFFEHDTGTETLTTAANKVTKYADLARSGVPVPVVLFHLPNRTREQHFHDALRRNMPGGALPVPVATTTATPEATTANPDPDPAVATDPVWLTPGATRRVTLTGLPTARPTRPARTPAHPPGPPRRPTGGPSWGPSGARPPPDPAASRAA